MVSVGQRETGAAPGAVAGAGPGARTRLATRRRRPGLIGLAVLVVVGGGLAGAQLYQAAGAKTAVVVTARDIPAGHVLTRGDLTTVALAGPITAVSAAHLESLVGQNAAVHMVAGQVVNRAMVTDLPAVDGAHVLVGLALKAGQWPGDGVTAGDVVRLVLLPASPASPADVGAGVPPAVVLVDAARVYAIQPSQATADTTVVAVVVDERDGPVVVAAGSTGQVGLIKVGG